MKIVSPDRNVSERDSFARIYTNWHERENRVAHKQPYESTMVCMPIYVLIQIHQNHVYTNPRSIGMLTHDLHDYCQDIHTYMCTDTCKQHVAMHVTVCVCMDTECTCTNTCL